jgi:tRNA G18 (ribose-2'-O)-methylase SpoU
MITTVPISSLNHRDLTPYRTLRQSVEQFRKGMFIAEGTIVVQRLLESAHKIVSVLITPEWLEDYRERLDARPEQITVFVGKKELLNTIVGYNLHQSIMALGIIPAQETLNSVLTHSSPPHLFVAMDGLANAENIGVLVRNCTALGVQAILVGETSSSPY